MLQFIHEPIKVAELLVQPPAPQAGAWVTFEGCVRGLSHGREVSSMYYEAYEPLALKEYARIERDIRTQCEILELRCFHRVGQVPAGDTAVFIAVSATHRDSAFRACRKAIDELKMRLPIWKKELYADGTHRWL